MLEVKQAKLQKPFKAELIDKQAKAVEKVYLSLPVL